MTQPYRVIHLLTASKALQRARHHWHPSAHSLAAAAAAAASGDPAPLLDLKANEQRERSAHHHDDRTRPQRHA